MNSLLRTGATLAVVAGLTGVPAGAASAGTEHGEPTVRIGIRAVAFDAYTGNVTVKARVACDNADTGSWNVRLTQEVTARGSAPITCDGERHRSRIVLDPAKGRFEPGPADLTYGAVACSATSCVGLAASQTVELIYTP